MLKTDFIICSYQLGISSLVTNGYHMYYKCDLVKTMLSAAHPYTCNHGNARRSKRDPNDVITHTTSAPTWNFDFIIKFPILLYDHILGRHFIHCLKCTHPYSWYFWLVSDAWLRQWGVEYIIEGIHTKSILGYKYHPWCRQHQYQLYWPTNNDLTFQIIFLVHVVMVIPVSQETGGYYWFCALVSIPQTQISAASTEWVKSSQSMFFVGCNVR